MRWLHTADWHVGRTLRGRSRADEHRAALEEVARIADAEDVDLVLVAGDLFDLSAPAAESEEIVYRALLALAGRDRQVVVVAGNHDHPHRLSAVRPLLGLTRVHTAAYAARPDEGGVLNLVTRRGAAARIALVPFLSQRNIINAQKLMSEDADQHTLAYAERCSAIVQALSAGFDDGVVGIVIAHLTIVGGVMGGGEREAHTVFDYHVPPQVFSAATHYVALGHLHRTQRIPGPCPIWYSGSPLQLDFGEGGNEPAVLVVEAAAGMPARVRTIPVTEGRRLRTLRGSLAALEAARDDVGDDHLRVFVDEPARAGLADEVRALFPNAVDVRIVRAEEESRSDDWSIDHVHRSPAELFDEYLAEKRHGDTDVAALFRELLETAGEA